MTIPGFAIGVSAAGRMLNSGYPNATIAIDDDNNITNDIEVDINGNGIIPSSYFDYEI